MSGFRRFVALGDSQTEGLNDQRAAGTPRGWADRLAERLAATTSPNLRYANLAVRGCRARHVRDVQLPRALELRPDLATVAVGMNDLLRHNFDLDATMADIETTLRGLQDVGAQVVSMTSPDIGLMLPSMRWLSGRQRAFQDRLRSLHTRLDVPTLELTGLGFERARELWSSDRIHGSSEGHRRVGDGMARLLGLPGSDDTWSEVTASRLSPVRLVVGELHWARTFLGPFLSGQLTGRRRGRRDGPATAVERVGKRLDLLPVDVPDAEPCRS